MSPMVKPVFLLNDIAIISVPSITPPPLMARPIPAPIKKPPNTDTNNLSAVKIGKLKINKHTANAIIPNDVLITKLFPICLYPIKIKGMLRTIIKIGKFIAPNLEINKETPVIPPSIKLLGNKKLFNPNDEEQTPTKIKNTLMVSRFKINLNSKKDFART